MATNITKRDYKEWLDFCDRVKNTTQVSFNESKIVQNQRIKRALKDYNFFVKTYFPIYADCDCAYFHIEAANKILKDKNIMAVLEWPREHAKSVHANILIPMWLMAHGELTGMILMGKNRDDANNLLADIQAQLMNNQLFAYDFGDQFNYGSWEEGDFTTLGGIRFLAIGRDQSPRGARKAEKRPNYAVIDDIDDDIIVNNPKRVKEIIKRILGALFFALSTKGARLVMAGNRIHSNSILANMVGDTKPGAKKREGIYHNKVYATENKPHKKAYISEGGKPAWPRYTIEEINEKLLKAGRIIGGQEFYHETQIEGEIFKDEMIRFKILPPLSKYEVIIGYFDPSFENNQTSDFKAIRVWGLYEDEYHCLGSFVQRTQLMTCFLWMGNYEDKLPSGVGIVWYVEEQFFNSPIKQALKAAERTLGRKINVIVDKRQKENKYTRMVKMEPTYSLGKVFYDIKLLHDPDTITGNNQLKGIEPGYKSPDDSPDADEGAWFHLSKHEVQSSFKPRIGRKRTKSRY